MVKWALGQDIFLGVTGQHRVNKKLGATEEAPFFAKSTQKNKILRVFLRLNSSNRYTIIYATRWKNYMVNWGDIFGRLLCLVASIFFKSVAPCRRFK